MVAIAFVGVVAADGQDRVARREEIALHAVIPNLGGAIVPVKGELTATGHDGCRAALMHSWKYRTAASAARRKPAPIATGPPSASMSSSAFVASVPAQATMPRHGCAIR